MIDPLIAASPDAGRALQHLSTLISSLGDDHFGDDLLGVLHRVIGAEHCTLFRFGEQAPREIFATSRDGTDTAHRQFSLFVSGSYWRNDSAITAALTGPAGPRFNMSCTDIRAMPAGDYRNRLYGRARVGERILLWVNRADCPIGLSILRSEERAIATDQELTDLRDISAVLMPLVTKHADLLDKRSGFARALTCLDEIEVTMDHASVRLPKREAQVCARIVYGMSSAGIALDLEIGEETVATYRKRAYQRLAIGSQRELLSWYVNQWSRLSSRDVLASIESGTLLS